MDRRVVVTGLGTVNPLGKNVAESWRAIREVNPLASKRVTGPMPFSAARIAAQLSATFLPSGFTVPSPVTTTLRCMVSSSLTSPARRRRETPAR